MEGATGIGERIIRERVIAVLRLDDPDAAPTIVDALIGANITAIEVTMTTPGAVELIRALAGDPRLLVGAGSVLTSHDAEQVISCGARFYASPVFDPSIVTMAREAGVLAMPGALTPTEIHRAWASGAELIKVFPMPADGAAYIRSVLAPLPHIRLAPSGGVSDTTAAALLRAGATALNVGSWLTHNKEGGYARPEEIEERGRRLMAVVREVNGRG